MFETADFCRICLSKTIELIAIGTRVEDTVSINEKLIFINANLIPPDDPHPKCVCVVCEKQINDAFCLVEKALDSYKLLDKLKSTGQTNLVQVTDDIAEIKDLLQTIPEIEIKEEIEILEFQHSQNSITTEEIPTYMDSSAEDPRNKDSTMGLTKTKDPTLEFPPNKETTNKNTTNKNPTEGVATYNCPTTGVVLRSKNPPTEFPTPTTCKDTTNVLKIRSISSINAIIHSSQSREEVILGGTPHDTNLLVAEPPKTVKTNPRLGKKGPIKVLFNPKNGRIVPIKQSVSVVAKPQQHPVSKYLTESEQYTCDICWKSFRSQIGFTVHKNWHERLERTVPGIVYTCEYCRRAPFKSLGDLKKHIDGHSSHFKRLKKLKQREDELRDGKMILPGIDLRESPRPVCAECKKSFCNFGDLNRHRRFEKHETHKLYNTQKD